MRIREITLHRVALPLVTPYRLSYHSFESFEPILVEVRDEDGRRGWGEGHISPGSGAETRAGGWAYAREQAGRVLGLETAAAKTALGARLAESKVAATALVTAIEMLEGSPLLEISSAARLPLLTPFNALDEPEIGPEVEARLAQGFKTFKIKVGRDREADLGRLRAIQEAVRGRAGLRLDANRAFSREDGCRFAAALDPEGIELLEQPCAEEDWAANAAVAAVSPVPVMLDEPICDIADIDRAAEIDGVALCKLKLKRFGGLERLRSALLPVRARGMTPVLGDGLGGELSCWMEACVARATIDNAGEFNGYLKPKVRLFAEPLPFADGALVLPAGYRPAIDRAKLAAHTLEKERFAKAIAAVPASWAKTGESMQ